MNFLSRIAIRTRCGEWTAELDKSDISNEIWLSLPFSADINMLGSQIYFLMPTETKVKGDATIFNVGDIVYWPEADALCIFFGPTPISGDDGKPVASFPMKKIGNVIGDCSGMEMSGDRTRITMERSF
jgi:hypothetical protein